MIAVERSDLHFDVALNAPACTEFEPDCLFTGAERLQTRKSHLITSASAFVKDSWYPTDQLTVHGGAVLQGEDFLHEWFVEPRLAAQYQVRDDLAVTAGLGAPHMGVGACVGDYNNDGWLDIYVTSYGPTADDAPPAALSSPFGSG